MFTTFRPHRLCRAILNPRPNILRPISNSRKMATIIHSSTPHEDRTASEPRQNRLEPVTISHIHPINATTRILRLKPTDPTHTIAFLPGQWLDTFIPSLPKAGGFTITSAPALAHPQNGGYIELAVQNSANPPARFLHRPEEEILNSPLTVRVGGSFTYPPARPRPVQRLVLIAGGVGVNPLVSMLAHIVRQPAGLRPEEIHFVYGVKAEGSEPEPQEILFLPRLMDLCAMAGDEQGPGKVTLSVFLTGSTGRVYGEGERVEHGRLPNRTWARRMGRGDLVGALDGWGGGSGREGTVAYVCGPQAMTDEVVGFLRGQEGMEEDRVLCEKWW